MAWFSTINIDEKCVAAKETGLDTSHPSYLIYPIATGMDESTCICQMGQLIMYNTAKVTVPGCIQANNKIWMYKIHCTLKAKQGQSVLQVIQKVGYCSRISRWVLLLICPVRNARISDLILMNPPPSTLVNKKFDHDEFRSVDYLAQDNKMNRAMMVMNPGDELFRYNVDVSVYSCSRCSIYVAL